MGIRDRLENWAEAARWGLDTSGRSRACSIEGRYRPPKREDEENGPAKSIKPAPNFKDAELVNDAWLLLPLLDRLMLKFLYVDNAPIAFICRKCKIKQNPRWAFDIHRSKVEEKLQEILGGWEKSSHNTRTIRPPVIHRAH